MTKIFAAAAIVWASAAVSTGVQAGDSYSFEIGGRSIHIEQPSNCTSASCISVSIPGVYESAPKKKRARAASDSDQEADLDSRSSRDSSKKDLSKKDSPRKDSAALATPPSDKAPEKSLEPANGVTTTATAPTSAAQAPEQAPARETAPVVATAAVSSPPPQQQSAVQAAPQAATSPLGVWLTEESEGKVRIEACGNNLCGYSVDAKSDRNGDKVLINMKPTAGAKWAGRIFDPNSGSTYDSTIAMKGSDRLRVQGCAFGGMFCGGQTWTRVN